MASFCFQMIAFGSFKEGACVLIHQIQKARIISAHDIAINLISDDLDFITENINLFDNINGYLVTDNLKKRVNSYLSSRENVGSNFFNTLYKYITFLDHGMDFNIWMDADMLLTGATDNFLNELSNVKIGFVSRMKVGIYNDPTILTCRMKAPDEYSFLIAGITNKNHDKIMWNKFIGLPSERHPKDFPRVNTGLFVVGKSFMSRSLTADLLQFASEPKTGNPGPKMQSDQNDLNIAIKRGFFGDRLMLLPEKFNVNVGEIKSSDDDLTNKVLNDVFVLHYPGEKKPWSYMDDLGDTRSPLNKKRNFFWRSRKAWHDVRTNLESVTKPFSTVKKPALLEELLDWKGIPF